MEPSRTPSRRRRNLLLVGAGVILVVVVGLFAWFRPDRAVIDQRVDDAIPGAVADAVADARRGPGATGPTGSESSTPGPSPTLIGSGEFTGQGGHSVRGRATVLRDGTATVLVLDDLDADNGPDLQLYLSPSAAGSVDGGRRLEPLRGNQGTQLYRLPADVDLAALPNVVIWCDRFSTPFGTATLRA